MEAKGDAAVGQMQGQSLAIILKGHGDPASHVHTSLGCCCIYCGSPSATMLSDVCTSDRKLWSHSLRLVVQPLPRACTVWQRADNQVCFLGRGFGRNAAGLFLPPLVLKPTWPLGRAGMLLRQGCGVFHLVLRPTALPIPPYTLLQHRGQTLPALGNPSFSNSLTWPLLASPPSACSMHIAYILLLARCVMPYVTPVVCVCPPYSTATEIALSSIALPATLGANGWTQFLLYPPSGWTTSPLQTMHAFAWACAPSPHREVPGPVHVAIMWLMMTWHTHYHAVR